MAGAKFSGQAQTRPWMKIPLALGLLLLGCMGGSWVPRAGAVPDLWAARYANSVTTCTQHPARGMRFHRDPIVDSTISITLTDSTGAAVGPSAVCPGGTYTLTTSYPNARNSLVTAAYGASTDFPTGLRIQQARGVCTNRVTNSITPATSHTATLTLPCYYAIPGGAIYIRVTSAAASTDAYRQADATYTVNPACGVGQCAASLPSPSTNPAASPSSDLPPASETTPPADLAPPATAPSLSDVASPPSPPACRPSSLNYSCSLAIDSIATVHWSLGGEVPENLCTWTRDGSSPLAGVNETEGPAVLHMALEALTSGYVGLGFSTPGGGMTPSDVAWGAVPGPFEATVDTWNIPSGNRYYMASSNALPTSWASYQGIIQLPPPPRGQTTTILCFTRPLQSPYASVSANLTADGMLHMIYSAAEDGVTSLGTPHVHRGAFTIDLASMEGSVSSVYSHRKWVRLHGILMATAWAGVIPLGALMARHRWLLGDHKLGGALHTWFTLHIATQFAGIALFTVAIAFAWHYFSPYPYTRGGGGVSVSGAGEAHRWMAVAVVILAGLQVLAGIIRPSPRSQSRRVWYLIHSILARLLIPTAWANVLLGIILAHESPAYRYSYKDWLIPVTIVMGTLLLLDILLTLLRPRTGRVAASPDTPSAPPMVNYAYTDNPSKYPHPHQPQHPQYPQYPQGPRAAAKGVVPPLTA